MGTKIKMFLPLIVVALLWFIPAPEGLTQDAWRFLAVFLGVVVGLILEPVPAALVGFAGISFVAFAGLVGNAGASIKWALSGFSNTVIWLIFAAFMFAVGYKKTGLGKRISLLMIKYMGKSSLGLGYAIAFSDFILSPFMPSNTARSAGTLYPIISNIPLLFNSTPDNDPRKLGAYLCWVAIAVTSVTSSMFITALAPNLLAVDLIAKETGTTISWGEWAMVMVPLMLPLLLLTPWLAYVLYPPTQKQSPEAPAWAAAELEKLGKITPKELLMGALAIFALIFWIFGKQLGVNGTTVAISVVSLMVLFKIIEWDDIISNKAAFNILIWFASLVAMAAGLNKVGILKWIGSGTEAYLAGMSPIVLMVIMLALFFFLHYFFASVTAHTTALLPIFLVIASSLLAPEQVMPFAILLAGTLGIMGIITPYATGPSPIWYGANYIPQATFWGLGAIFGIVYIIPILIGVFIFV